MRMTLSELNDKLAEQIELLTGETKTWAEKKNIMESAMVVSSLAKQMINSADVMLRTGKLVGEKKVAEDSSIARFAR